MEAWTTCPGSRRLEVRRGILEAKHSTNTHHGLTTKYKSRDEASSSRNNRNGPTIVKTFGGRTSRGGGGGMSSTASDDHRSGLLPQQQQQRQAGGGHIGRQGPCSSTRHAQQQPLPSRPQQRQHGYGTTRRKLVLLVELILFLVIMPSYQIIYEAVNYTSFGTGTSTSTNTSNNNKNMMKRKSITYRLYDKAKVQYKDKFNPLMRCSDDREGLSPSLGSKTVLGFTTSIQLRNLNVLLMGDSVMIQFGQAFQSGNQIFTHIRIWRYNKC